MAFVLKSHVKPEWVDYNGHMSEAFYVLVFGYATDEFYELCGIGSKFRNENNVSVYTAQAHITYLREVKEGEVLNIDTELIAFDDKKIHLFHTMYNKDYEYKIAEEEILALHVDTSDGAKVVAFHDKIKSNLEKFYEDSKIKHDDLNFGRKIELVKK